MTTSPLQNQNPYMELPWMVRLRLERELGSNIPPAWSCSSCRDLLAALSAAPIWLQQPSFQFLQAHRPHLISDRLCGVQGTWCHHIWRVPSDLYQRCGVNNPPIYYLNIREFPNYTRIKLGLFFSLFFSFSSIVQSPPCRALPPKAQTRFMFLSVRLDNSPGAQTPSAAAAESVRSLYIVHGTDPVIMIGLSPRRQVRGWAS